MVQRAFSGLATCKMLRAFSRCSRASNDTGAPCNPIRGRAVGWCARSEEDTCSMLRAFSRSRGRDVPASASRWFYSSSMPLLRLQPSPVVHMVRRGKAVASRFGGPPCSARDLSKRFWSYAGPFLMPNRGVGRASAFMGVRDTAICLKLLSSLSENPSMKLLGVS